jgi:hypothetical protein
MEVVSFGPSVTPSAKRLKSGRDEEPKSGKRSDLIEGVPFFCFFGSSSLLHFILFAEGV